MRILRAEKQYGEFQFKLKEVIILLNGLHKFYFMVCNTSCKNKGEVEKDLQPAPFLFGFLILLQLKPIFLDCDDIKEAEWFEKFILFFY